MRIQYRRPLASADKLCRRSRVTIAEREAIAEDTEEAIRRKEEEAAERKKESHDLVAESIKRELAESASAVLYILPSLTYAYRAEGRGSA